MKLNLEEIEAKAKAATPGPWVQGFTYGQHLRPGEDTCHHCGVRPLLRVADSKPANDQWSSTVHFHLNAKDDSHEIISTEDGSTVCGSYDYEEGGVVEIKDAAYIAAADPPTVLALVSRVREYQDLIEDALEGPLRFDDQAWCKKARAALEGK